MVNDDVSDDELGSAASMWHFPWIVGLYHFVQTRKAKHSAMLEKGYRDFMKVKDKNDQPDTASISEI